MSLFGNEEVILYMKCPPKVSQVGKFLTQEFNLLSRVVALTICS